MGEALNMYPNLNNQQHFKLIKSMKLKIILLQILEKED